MKLSCSIKIFLSVSFFIICKIIVNGVGKLSQIIHQALLPKEKIQDFVFFCSIGSESKPINSALSLNFYDFDEEKSLLSVSPILSFEKVINFPSFLIEKILNCLLIFQHALMEDVRILNLSATYARPINWRPHKKAKLIPGYAVIHQTCLYIFKPQDVCIYRPNILLQT